VDDDIVPVFCPTSQIAFWYRKSLIPLAPATLHGVVFDIFLLAGHKSVPQEMT
jgi:hypothetical protein